MSIYKELSYDSNDIKGIKVIKNNYNGGYASGINLGIKYIENFEAGGSWGDNASLGSVRNTKNNNPLFLFKYIYWIFLPRLSLLDNLGDAALLL